MNASIARRVGVPILGRRRLRRIHCREAHGPGVTQGYLAQIEIPRAKGKDCALRVLKASRSSGDVNSVYVVEEGAVWVGSREAGQIGICEEDRITRLGDPVMTVVKEVRVDKGKHLNPDRASKVACCDAVSASVADR